MKSLTIISIFLCSIVGFAMEFSISPKGEPFLRIVEDGDYARLELASKTYSNPAQGLTVTLLAAIHFAQDQFYERQMEIARQSSCTLYEGKGLDKIGIEWNCQPLPAKVNRSHHFSIIAKSYNLSLQLEKIDHSYVNFVHADFSFQEECPKLEERLRDFAEFIEHYNNKYDEQGKKSELNDGYEYYINIQINNQKQIPLKSLIESLEKQTNNIETLLKEQGEDFYSREFMQRNNIVLDKFAQQAAMATPENPKHIIIFYGAGHMPYFEAELRQKYNLRFQSEEWISSCNF